MHLQSSTCPRAPPITRSSPTQHHTQYTHNAHQLLEHPVIEPETPTTHPWQTVKKRTQLPMETTARGHQSPFNSPNQFEELSHLSDDDTQTPASVPRETTSSEHATQPRVHKPSPIYVYGVINYRDMVKYLTETFEEEQYYCKALPNETVKNQRQHIRLLSETNQTTPRRQNSTSYLSG